MPASCTSPAIEHEKLISSSTEIESDENIDQHIQSSASNSKKQSNIAKLTSGSTIEEMIRMRNLKTSQNITESVPVPSSEHVAEIVGRQGCKIKALRAKTNTYIKTPIRGEQPQFVITGRKEDVITAKREIQLAADHFSQIRARRTGNSGSHTPTAQQQLISSPCNTRQGTPTPPINTPSKTNSVSSSSSSSISLSPPIAHKITNVLDIGSSSSSCISPKLLIDACDLPENDSTLIRQQTEQVMQLQPGQIVEKVTVPYQVVGLVVGPRGTTIKRIQQNTNTYIKTPSRDSQPVFDIQGIPSNVAQAKIEIENYIQLRTNNNITPTPPTNGYCSSSSSSSSSSTTEPQNGHLYNNNMLGAYQQNNKNDYEFFSNAFELMDELKLNKKSDMLHEASIWSSPVNTFTQEDSLVNSIQQNLNPTLNSLNAGIRSSLSSSSSTSSSASSSFSLAKTDASSFQFFNNSSSNNSNTDQLSGLISNMDAMNMYGLKSNTDNFLNHLSDNNTFSASSSLSSSSCHESHSLFQHHEHLSNDSPSQDFLYPGAASFFTNNFQQQPQYF